MSRKILIAELSTNPNFFIFMESCIVLCIVVLGGVGSIPGIILAGVVLIAVPEVFREFQAYRMLAFGLAMATMMVPFFNRKLVNPCLCVLAPVCVHRTGRRRQVSKISIFQFPRLAGSSTPSSGSTLRFDKFKAYRLPIFITQILINPQKYAKFTKSKIEM